jgi:hypothetical protein
MLSSCSKCILRHSEDLRLYFSIFFHFISLFIRITCGGIISWNFVLLSLYNSQVSVLHAEIVSGEDGQPSHTVWNPIYTFVGAISNVRFEVLTAVSVDMGRGTIVW